MHVALGLLDADHDALQIFIFSLHIGAGFALDEGFAGFHDIAGFVFIGNGHGYDVYFHEILDKVFGSAHIHHLEEALLGDVNAVLGASLALGDPDGACAGGDGFADILGQHLRRQVQFAGRYTADDLDHAVGTDEQLYRLLFEEVVSHADLGLGQAVPHEDHLR